MRQTIMAPHYPCVCGHLISEHRIDLKGRVCETAGCDCREVTPGAAAHVVRIVCDPGEDPDVLGQLEEARRRVRELERWVRTEPGWTCACGAVGVRDGQAALVDGRLHARGQCERLNP